MVTLVNNVVGSLLLVLSLIRIKFSSSLKFKYRIIENVITKVNAKETNLPANLILSIIKIEDERYFDHKGVDFYSILRAIYKCITTDRIEGASTITQQMIRNITNDRGVSIKRKMNEITLSILINKKFSKDELMFAYMETYLFNKCVGIYAFCKKELYNIESLSTNECAQIAGRLKYPTINSSNYIKYLKRVRTIEIKTIMQ